MKITKLQLEQIIKEEIINMLQEAPIDRLKGGAGDPRSTRVGLGDKPMASVGKMTWGSAGPEEWRTGSRPGERKQKASDLMDEFEMLEDELRTALSTGHPVDGDRKAKIFDLKAAMKRTAHEIKTYNPQFEMPEWIDDPTWEGFRAMEKIPGMLDKVPTNQELAAIKLNVSEMYGDVDKLEEISANGKPQLPKHLSDAYREAADIVLDQMVSNQDYPQ